MRTPARSANAKSFISSAGRAMCADCGAGSARAVDDLHCMSCLSCNRSTPTERGGTPSSTRSATSCAGTTSRRDGSARRGHAIRSDLDAEPKLPRADRRDKADRACAENRQRRAGSATERSLLARQRHVTGGSSGAKSPPPADRTRQGSPGWPQLRPKHRCHRA